ncbi:MAG: helix-turn-helix domain-containing protein [Polyangiaceae bacterium]
MTTRSRDTDVATELPPPDGLSGYTVVVDRDEYMVLAFPTPSWTLPECLTEAERSIALAILQGATNEQVACERRRSLRTVGNHIARIFAKVGVSSRIEFAHRLASGATPR